jgi:Resolvase, N terminal domain
MSKIMSEHLARAAFVYVRQSTAYQVVNNLESQRRQYGLVERARHLGWDDVQLVDDDLGRSGGGTARPGFEKLLAAICEGRVGAVVSLEASRLARNGRDWHTLLEFCGLVGTLIVDEEAIYDPRSPNDIDQAWRLSRINGWMGSTCKEAFWVEHHGSVFSPVQIRAAARQAIAGQRGRAVPAPRRGVRRARCRQDWRASCRATPDIARGSA